MYDKNGQLYDRREMLRVKLKNLAQEARLIRREETRTRAGQLRDELALHRRTIVRTAARETHLAYGFIRDIPLERMERNCGSKDWLPPDWAAVAKMVRRYGRTGGAACPCLVAAMPPASQPRAA